MKKIVKKLKTIPVPDYVYAARQQMTSQAFVDGGKEAARVHAKAKWIKRSKRKTHLPSFKKMAKLENKLAKKYNGVLAGDDEHNHEDLEDVNQLIQSIRQSRTDTKEIVKQQYPALTLRKARGTTTYNEETFLTEVELMYMEFQAYHVGKPFQKKIRKRLEKKYEIR